MTVSNGFFPPNKHDGCVIMFRPDHPHTSLHYLTPGCAGDGTEHEPFFYHKVEWIDMDNDGDLDAVTARVINDGPITPIDQDLLWLENPGSLPADGYAWTMHKIAGTELRNLLNVLIFFKFIIVVVIIPKL